MSPTSDTMKALDALLDNHAPKLLAAGGASGGGSDCVSGKGESAILSALGLSKSVVRQLAKTAGVVKSHGDDRRGIAVFQHNTLRHYRPLVILCIGLLESKGYRLSLSDMHAAATLANIDSRALQTFLYKAVGTTKPWLRQLRTLLSEINKTLGDV